MPCRSGFLPLRLGCGEGGDKTRYILVTKTKEKKHVKSFGVFTPLTWLWEETCQVIWGIYPFDLAVRRWEIKKLYREHVKSCGVFTPLTWEVMRCKHIDLGSMEIVRLRVLGVCTPYSQDIVLGCARYCDICINDITCIFELAGYLPLGSGCDIVVTPCFGLYLCQEIII